MREGSVFGASNPPLEIYEAKERLDLGLSEDVEGDRRVVDAFVRFHYGYTEGSGKLKSMGSSRWSSLLQLVSGVGGWFLGRG